MSMVFSWLEVKGSKLTDGARALAKHLNRSSDGYWGTFCGSGKFLMNMPLQHRNSFQLHLNKSITDINASLSELIYKTITWLAFDASCH